MPPAPPLPEGATWAPPCRFMKLPVVDAKGATGGEGGGDGAVIDEDLGEKCCRPGWAQDSTANSQRLLSQFSYSPFSVHAAT